MLNNTLKILVTVFLIFAVINGITAAFYSQAGESVMTRKVSEDQSILGPINIEKDNTSLRVTVSKDLTLSGNSSEIYCDILDENKEPLFGFNDELYYETGYDSEGYWSEKRNKTKMDITLSQKGTYYLEFYSESYSGSGRKLQNTSAVIKINRLGGSYIPFLIAAIFEGVFACLMGLVLYLRKETPGKRGGVSRIAVIISVVVLSVIYIVSFPVSNKGYGYAGYGRHYGRPSYFYFGRSRYYSSRSVREESAYGSRSVGRGPGSGK